MIYCNANKTDTTIHKSPIVVVWTDDFEGGSTQSARKRLMSYSVVLFLELPHTIFVPA